MIDTSSYTPLANQLTARPGDPGTPGSPGYPCKDEIRVNYPDEWVSREGRGEREVREGMQ